MDIQKYQQLFVEETQSSMQLMWDALEQLKVDPTSKDAYFEVMRMFHSLKSCSAIMGHTHVHDACRQMEMLYKEVNEDESQAIPEIITLTEKNGKGIEDALNKIADGEVNPTVE
jgi:chemotaxis protein histidine kinase CheA